MAVVVFFRESCYGADGELLIPFMLQKFTMDLVYVSSSQGQSRFVAYAFSSLHVPPWASCCTIRGGMCKNELFIFLQQSY